MDPMVFIRIANALNPLQSVRVKFTDGLDGIRMLSVLNSAGAVNDKALAAAVIVSQDWAKTGRVMNVSLSEHLISAIQGLPRLAERGIESIDSGRDSPLNALQTSREKKRLEAYLKIANVVAPRELYDEVQGYSLLLEVANKRELDFFNFMTFSVRNGNEVEEIMSLDGWSGNILNGHRKATFFCATLDFAKEQLRHYFNSYLDRVTAVA